MNISKVNYHRLKNLGNYENERFECEVVLGPEEDAHEAFQIAMRTVWREIVEAERQREVERQREQEQEQEYREWYRGAYDAS